MLCLLPAVALAQVDNSDAAVLLDDREFHNWSYYSDPTCHVRSLNPADVKITYYGYGDGTMYTTDATSGTPTGNVLPSQVGIGIDAPYRNTYIYRKTLERANGEQAVSMAAADGPCQYVPIPNPFSRRPTHGTGDSRWRGFYKWRIKSISSDGSRIYADRAMTQQLNAGSMVDAEDTLWFMPGGEYSMEVEFEAIWARAFVYHHTDDLNNAADGEYATGANAYERNFVVIDEEHTGATTTSATALTSATREVTLTAVHPDGTDGTGSALLSAVPTGVWFSQCYHCGANTKFEYLTVQATTHTDNKYFKDFNYVNAYGRMLVIGRGVAPLDPSSDCFEVIAGNYYQQSKSNDPANRDTRLRIESGRYLYAYLLGCNEWSYVASSILGSPIFSGDTCNVRGIGLTRGRSTWGSDYDRARGNNDLLLVRGMMRGTAPALFYTSDNASAITYSWVFKSGTFQPDSLGNAEGQQGVYLGATSNPIDNLPKYQGKRHAVIEGGNFASIAGGCDPRYDGFVDTTQTMVNIRIKGGTIRGCVYGAAEHAVGRGNRRLVFTGGYIHGWVAGATNGTKVNDEEINYGSLVGDTYIYFGGDAIMRQSDDDPYLAFSRGGNLFGAGSGNSANTGERATVGRVNNSTVVVADRCFISRDVYGGGNYGYVRGEGSRIQVLGGFVQGKVFGGANHQQGHRVDIDMRGGQVVGSIYGGSNTLGTVTGPVTITVTGGIVGLDGYFEDEGNIFGCGYGAGTSVTGDVNIYFGVNDPSAPHSDNPLVCNSIYCGGYLGAYNSTSNTFQVTTYNGRVKGSVFGGGYGKTATITGDTHVNVLGTTHVEQNVYGGGNMGKVTGNTNIVIGK